MPEPPRSAAARDVSPSLLRNPLSLIGLAVAVLSSAFGLPLMVLDIVSPQTNPYLGVLIYLALPLVAIGGVGLTALGAILERRRRARRPGIAVPPLPRIDLNRPAHQLALLLGALAVLTIVALLSVTGYRAYHFTESTRFCGVTCHSVMKPEFTAYHHSPHARVACTECHVGPGASWFVRSKLSGLYQVYAVATNRYPRPIPAPVKNLRPAQETCERCHWPAKFFGAQQKTIAHYLADEANSPWHIQMLLKTGGGDSAAGSPSGIHWHMNIKSQIDYVATDEQRQAIPWVRVTEPDGTVTEYTSTEQPLSPEQLASAALRRMDCVDCHNRPSHRFLPPDRAVEQAMAGGRLERSLPYLRREGVRLLAGSYASEQEAEAAIADGLRAFYQREYARLAGERAPAIEAAAAELVRIYRRTIFPEMRADWRAYPDHLGHLNSLGCFRCHDGLHRSPAGTLITRDCNACHTILAQGPPDGLAAARLSGQSFEHPVDLGMDASELQCSACHSGTSGL